MKNQNHQNQHIPVLLEDVLKCLGPRSGDSYLDLTAGYGGHAQEILNITKDVEQSVLIDRDKNATTFLSKKFEGKVKIIKNDFANASKILLDEGHHFDMILADLGVSSPHLDNSNRGFSIRQDGPLDMRMDQDQVLMADEVVNAYSEPALADIIRQFGEEPRARSIAKKIVEARPLNSTSELAETVSKAVTGYHKIHPATRTFQAIRIAVNSELELLKQAIPLWVELLNPGGRIVIISFHSLEDRIVKNALKEFSGNRYDATLRLIGKQPITASSDELVSNPRARSAKLRAAVKINTK